MLLSRSTIGSELAQLPRRALTANRGPSSFWQQVIGPRLHQHPRASPVARRGDRRPRWACQSSRSRPCAGTAPRALCRSRRRAARSRARGRAGTAATGRPARGHYRFEHWVKEPLDSLCSEFDLKYWPDLDDLLNALAQDAAGAEIVATDPLTRAATECGRAGLAAVFRALLAGIEEQKGASDPSWPADFRPTDATLATLISAALNLGPEELVGAECVKRLRQRYRDNGRKQSEP